MEGDALPRQWPWHSTWPSEASDGAYVAAVLCVCACSTVLQQHLGHVFHIPSLVEAHECERVEAVLVPGEEGALAYGERLLL